MSNNFVCDICRKKLKRWQFWRKGIKCVMRIKDDFWVEYYHMDCALKTGLIKKKPNASLM